MATRAEVHQKNIEKIFYPESIAIVGTNKVKGTVPFDILNNILKADFNGVVYPVSPGERYIAGVKAYKYVTDIPDEVDLAILVFPSSVCHLALEQCGKKGVKSLIIISAGFKEVGGIGIEREKKIKEIAEKYGMSFIGPNCLGVINPDPKVRLNASFARKMPEDGSIGFLSQSGALCTAVLDYAYSRHIGFSKFVSFGNKADVSEIDLLYYLRDDPRTKVILMYLEEVSNGKALIEAAQNVIQESGKPILVIKSGRTSEGAAAAASHTGSLAGSDDICDAAFEQAGMIRCDNLEEMFNKAIAFAYQPVPRTNKIAIITNAGGPGVLTTDAAIEDGLELAKFSDETTKIFKKSLPKTANINNPVDVIGDARADRYNVALSAAFKDENVDSVFVILTPQSMTEIDLIAREIAKVASHYDKPVYASFMGEADVAQGIDVLQRNRIPHYLLPESMARSMATVYKFSQYVKQKKKQPPALNDVDSEAVKKVLEEAKKQGRDYLPEADAVKILAAYKLPVLKSKLVKSESEAVKAAQEIEYPVVMKIMSDDVVHKFDVGGVVLNIENDEDAKDAYNSIMKNIKKHDPQARIQGILVTQMVSGGDEVILGAKYDPAFGSVIMFGLGGIFVEIFKDVTFKVAPLAEDDAEKMLQEIRSAKILEGVRGKAPRDRAAIIDAIVRLSRLAADFPEIKELDINPMIVLNEGKGCYVADARIMI